MADFVFQGLPNIHGHAYNYEGGQITRQFQGNHFDNIKSRYIAVMKAQLVRQQNSEASKRYIEALSDAQFLNLENRLENELVSSYNNNVIPALNSTYIEAARGIDYGLKTQNKQKVIESLNKIISIFKSASPQLQGLIYETNSNELSVIPAELDDLLGVSRILDSIDKNYNSQSVNSVLTPSGEVVSILKATVDDMAEDAGADCLMKALRGRVKGASGMQVTMDQNPSRTVENKATDVQLPNVKYRETVKRQAGQAISEVELNVEPYATVKTYRSRRSNIAKMISYANRNSITMDVLHSIYGNNDEINYQLYNTIAFNGREHTDLTQNFKIIKSDMVAELAEKYIIGYNNNSTTASQIMIHNFKAYPILVVLSAIAQQAKEATEKGGLYGGTGSIFSIRFDAMYKIKNTWEVSKLERVREVKRAIDNISTRGYLNINQFNKFIESKGVEGISLVDIIPRIPKNQLT